MENNNTGSKSKDNRSSKIDNDEVDLFSESAFKFREYDVNTAQGELDLRLKDLEKQLEKLDEAREISQELWETTICV